MWLNDGLPFNACINTDCKVIRSGGSFIISDNLDCNITAIPRLSDCTGFDGILHYYGNTAECRLTEKDRYSFLADQNTAKHWLSLVMCNSSAIKYITVNEVIRNTQAGIISKDFDQNYRTIMLNEN
jgi:hypothetical protein